MPIDLSFIGQGIKPFSTSQGEQVAPENDDVERVRSIMEALGPLMGSMEQTPQAPKPILPSLPTGGQQIMGGIGDALLAAAQARLGHSPTPGPFARDFAETEKERTALQNRALESQAAQASQDRMERNRIRAMAGVVGIRAGEHQPKSLQRYEKEGVDAQGNPTKQAMMFDPATGKETPLGDPYKVYVKPNEPRQPHQQIITHEDGSQWVYDFDTKTETPTGHSKPPDAQTQQEMRVSALIKDRLARGEELIAKAQDTPRVVRAGEAAARMDPTGLLSGSDFAADARTYKNMTIELGSLTRGLYGAQGIRSYQEIQNLINTAPPWAAGKKAIAQWWDATKGAIKVADDELARVHPQYAAMGRTPTTATVPGENPSLPGPYAGRTLHESDFSRAKPGERERFISGGGTVLP